MEEVLHKIFLHLASVKMAYMLVKKILYSEQELAQISLEETKKKNEYPCCSLQRKLEAEGHWTWCLEDLDWSIVPTK